MIAGALEIDLMANVARLSKDMTEAKRVVGGAMQEVERTVERAKQALAGLGLGLGLRELIQISDQYTKYTAQLRLATQSEREFGAARQDVRRISIAAQGEIAATGTLYARITNSTRELGKSQREVSTITETVMLALKASGATAQESASATLQLSQAFASGVLRGEEFNAVNEAAPRLMKALAEGMGVPIGALREMAKAGLITSEVMANALPRSLADLRKEAAQVQTVAGAWQVLKNNVMEYVGANAQASGSIAAITSGIVGLAKNLDVVAAAVVGLTVMKLSSWVSAVASAVAQKTQALVSAAAAAEAERQANIRSQTAEIARLESTLAFIAADRQKTIVEMQAAQATIAATQAVGAQSGALALNTAAKVANSAATAELAALGRLQAATNAQLAASQAALTAAMSATTGAATVGARLLGLLGGPIGVITTLLGLGATAWMMWGRASEDANNKARASTEESSIEILRNLEATNSKLRERLELVRATGGSVGKSESPGEQRMAELLTQINALQAKQIELRRQGIRLDRDEQFALDYARQHYERLKQQLEEAARLKKDIDAVGGTAKAAEWMAKYATNTEKLAAELAKARKELGAAFTPEMEARIRKHFESKDKETRDALKREQKLREESAEAELKAEEMFAKDYAEAWKFYEEFRTKEREKGAAERRVISEAEAKGEEMFAKDMREAWHFYNEFLKKQGEERQAQVERQTRMWDDLARVAGNFFADLVMNGKSAFDNLRQWAKQLLADMIAIFAKRWILNLAAGGTVMGSAGDALASTVGGGQGSSLGGSLLSTGASWAGNALAGAAGFTGLGTWATFAGAASGAIPAAAIGSGAVAAGVGVNTAAASLGSSLSGVYTALANIPVWGWIAMAVIAIGAWIAGNHKGGPKVGGSFMGGFDAAGAFTGTVGVPGSDNGRFFTPNQGDDALRPLVEGTARGYIQAITALGGTAGAFNFGLGFDHDPAGTAQSRVSSMLTDANGRVIYSNLDRSMDDKEVDQALQLEAQRMLLAALQQAELPDAVAEILNSIVASGASGEEIQRVIAMAIEMKQVLDGLAAIDLKGLDITALKAWQREGESIGQAFQRVAQQWGDFNAAFLTDDQKLAATWEQIVAVFGQLGVAVPESNEAFLALVSGIDLSTEAGRRMWDMLHEVAPAFAAVENAVNGMVRGIIENLRGPMDPQSVLNTELDTFIANNPWAQGMSRDYVMQQLLTITPEDLASYIRAGQGANIGAISAAYRATQGGSGGMGSVGGVNINDAQVEATIAAREFAEALRDAKASLGDYLDASLLSDLSPLDPMQKLAEARKQFDATLALAQGGDLEAIGALGSRRDVYLDIARDIFASSSAYGDIFRTTFDQVAGVAGVDSYNERMLTISERQVTLQEMVANTLDRIRQESREDASYMTIQVTRAVREVRDAVRDTSTELR